MSVIKLSPVVAAVDEVIQIFDRIMVYRSGYGAGGPFAPITTPASAIPLVSGQLTYSYEDLEGDEGYYYCVQYINTQTGAVSGFSTPQLGSGSAAESIVSIAMLKQNYLFGLDLTDPSGNPFPDSMFSFYIAAAVAYVERQLDMPLTSKVITKEKHDYTQNQRQSYGWIQLDQFPLQSVQEVRVRYPGDPVGQVLPQSWVHGNNDTGVVQIVPAGSAGFTYNYAASAYAGWVAQKYIPDLFEVSYTAGFAPGQVPQDIVEVIAKTASYGPLNIAGDLLGGAGIASQSVSIDGLSQSLSTTSSPMYSGYGARLGKYDEENKAAIPLIRAYYKGTPLAVS